MRCDRIKWGNRVTWTVEETPEAKMANSKIVLLLFVCSLDSPAVWNFSLKALDVVTMKELYKRVNVIPIIAKADTTSKDELKRFKTKVRPYLFVSLPRKRPRSALRE